MPRRHDADPLQITLTSEKPYLAPAVSFALGYWLRATDNLTKKSEHKAVFVLLTKALVQTLARYGIATQRSQ
jgi:hypothetical protein